MISLSQIQLLENKIEKTLRAIVTLQAENVELRKKSVVNEETIADYKTKCEKLEKSNADFQVKYASMEKSNSEISQKCDTIEKTNANLEKECADYEKTNIELAKHLSVFQKDQNEIEKGITHALERLNSVEDSVLQTSGAELDIDEPNSMQTITPEDSSQSIDTEKSSDTTAESLTLIKPSSDRDAQNQQIEIF